MMTQDIASYFVDVESEDITLMTLDVGNFGISIDGIGIYRTAGSDEVEALAAAIERGVLLAISNSYHVFLGRPKPSGDGKAIVCVDKDNLNLPRIDRVLMDCTLEEFIDTKTIDRSPTPVRFFNTRRFVETKGMEPFAKSTYHKPNNAVHFSIIIFTDHYVALSYSMPHVLSDGTSVLNFLKTASNYAKESKEGSSDMNVKRIHNRTCVTQLLDDAEIIELECINHLRDEMKRSPIQLPKVDPSQSLEFILRSPDSENYTNQHIIHIGKHQLKKLRELVDDKTHSSNTVLVAFLVKCITIANTRVNNQVPPRFTYAAIPYDLRVRNAEIPSSYTGNASGIVIHAARGQDILDMSLSQVANVVKATVATSSASQTKSLMNTITSSIDVLYQSYLSLRNSETTAYICPTNVRYFDLKNVDFGLSSFASSPASGFDLIGFAYSPREGMAKIFPNYQDDGLDIVLNYPDAHFDALKGVELLNEYATVIY